MRRILTLSLALVALLTAPATAGQTGVVKPPSIFKPQLAGVKPDSGIDVYLPSRMRVFTRPSRVRGTAAAESGSYSLDLGIGRNCGGANACYVGGFTGTRGERPALGRRVRLADGRTARWKGITCGASCSPAEIQWVEDDVLYTIATKSVSSGREKATLVKLANEAIKAGPR